MVIFDDMGKRVTILFATQIAWPDRSGFNLP